MNDIGVVHSTIFQKHVCDDYNHVESPSRTSVLESLFEEEEILKSVTQEKWVSADDKLLLQNHSKAMIASLHDLRGSSGWIDPDTYYCKDSVETALIASGSTIQLALRIWNQELRRGFSIVRPPGHHATPKRQMGFCLLNNIALAVHAVLTETPQSRIAIVDFDLHHGNGTQESFYENGQVLFLSSHRFPYYPGTGKLEEVGEGKGKGTTLNFPIPHPLGDDLIVPLYWRLVYPALIKFRPDMIFVSAGFDAHERDPMQGLRMTTEGFGNLFELLILAAEKTSRGKILFVLEGGYQPQALKESVRLGLQKMVRLPREIFETKAIENSKEEWLLSKFENHFKSFF